MTEPDPVLDPRRRRRLLRYVPGFAIVFLLVGWVFAGRAPWIFALMGAVVGGFAAWRRRGEVVLGIVAAAGAVVAVVVAAGGPTFSFGGALAVASCGAAGCLAALDDRMRKG